VAFSWFFIIQLHQLYLIQGLSRCTCGALQLS